MKSFLVVFCSLFTAGLIQTVKGQDCDYCAACWLNGDQSTGIDIKWNCNDGNCGQWKCPPGYGEPHCAGLKRCSCDPFGCGDVGPCACGYDDKGGCADNTCY